MRGAISLRCSLVRGSNWSAHGRRHQEVGGSAIPPASASVPPGVEEPSDDSLLAGLSAGDGDAMTVFVRRFQRRVFGLAWSVVGDRVLAEDVAQEAFLRVWRSAGAYDVRRGSVAAWVLTITRNLSIDAVRARGSRPAPALERFVVELESDLLTPEGAAVQGDDMARVRAALATLTVGQRRAVLLASFGGRTAREVAEIDRIPVGTAKTRIRDGLRRLREALSSNDEDQRR